MSENSQETTLNNSSPTLPSLISSSIQSNQPSPPISSSSSVVSSSPSSSVVSSSPASSTKTSPFSLQSLQSNQAALLSAISSQETSEEQRNKSLKCFRLICDFFENLLVDFEKNTDVTSYVSLLKGTFKVQNVTDFQKRSFALSELPMIEKHCKCFFKFCSENKEALLERNENKINGKIQYSKNIVLDVKSLLCNTSSKENKIVLWKYLVSFLAISTDSRDEIMKLSSSLKNISEEESGENNNENNNIIKNNENNNNLFESDLLKDILEEMEHMDINLENPMDAMMKLISSGLVGRTLETFQGKMASGEINVKTLRNTMNNLFDTLEKKIE